MSPPVRCAIALPNPDDHLIHITMTFPVTRGQDALRLAMPVWSPGSYLVREYPRHIQHLRATTADALPLEVRQLDKSSWSIDLPNPVEEVIVRYELFAHELAVRTNHLDATHASINGVASFLYPIDALDTPVELSFVDIPDSWRAYSGLETLDEGARRYRASSFDQLYDSPIEVGPHEPLHFEACGVPHQIVIWGDGNHDAGRLCRDFKRIVETHAALFGGALPYAHYTFIIHLTDQGFGGLEHHNSTLLLSPRDGFRDGPPGSEVDEEGTAQRPYLDLMRLVSHEHFHTWNVKRIRPAVLGPFDYQRENYTRDLWTVEGITSYYELVGLLRAGLTSPAQHLKLLAEAILQLDSIPGRLLHSLEASSLNAWIKLYRPDEHTANSSVSYYLKGKLVTLILDARLRVLTAGERSFDDVLTALWRHYEETGQGYEEGSMGDWIERATGCDVRALLDRMTRSTEELDWEEALHPMGLVLERETRARGAWLGLKTRSEGPGRLFVVSTPTGSPAHQAGIYAGDELLALGERRLLDEGALRAQLARHRPCEPMSVTLVRRGQLVTRQVVPGEPPADTYRIVRRDDATPEQLALLDSWIGALS